MATRDEVHRMEYYAHLVDDKPGQGAALMKKLAQEGVNLHAMLAFPRSSGKTQIDLMPENSDQFMKAARKHGIPIEGPKTCFMIQGSDRPGALGEVMSRLANANINARASYGVSAGGGRYAGIVWVEDKDVEAAGRALAAVSMAGHKG